MLRYSWLIGSWLLLSSVWTAHAANFYVDNLQGSNAYDGRDDLPVSEESGPFRTISRALESARAGDIIIVINNQIPYYESLSLLGARLGTTQYAPIRIVGNGAVVSGLRDVPRDIWESVGHDLYRMTPLRKHWFQLLQDQKLLPQVDAPRNADAPPELKAGEWCQYRGDVYLRTEPFVQPRELELQFSAEDVGLSVYQVRQAEILDLTFQHFRINGIHVADCGPNILLGGVKSFENGRHGLVASGGSRVRVQEGEIARNASLAVEAHAFGRITIHSSKIDGKVVE